MGVEFTNMIISLKMHINKIPVQYTWRCNGVTVLAQKRTLYPYFLVGVFGGVMYLRYTAAMYM